MFQPVLAHCAGGATTWCDLGSAVALVLVVVAIFWAAKRAERKAKERRAAAAAWYEAQAALAHGQPRPAPPAGTDEGEVRAEPPPEKGYRRRSSSETRRD